MAEKQRKPKPVLDEHGEPVDPLTLRIYEAANAAIAFFEKVDGYASVQRDMGKRISAEFRKTGKTLPRPLAPNDDRLDYELKLMDIKADEFIKLVSNVEKQKRFLALLMAWGSVVWDRYRGIAPINADEDNPVVQKIGALQSKWEIAGWDRASSDRTDRPYTVAERVKKIADLKGVDVVCADAGVTRSSYFNLQNHGPERHREVAAKFELYLESTESPPKVDRSPLAVHRKSITRPKKTKPR